MTAKQKLLDHIHGGAKNARLQETKENLQTKPKTIQTSKKGGKKKKWLEKGKSVLP